ncbi:uncharacterized protein LOC131163829 [Malania oleifera]|uniref:uncharacterized protein LOC131163829 n=1 Tax=Malania oleifera TaxID=397392 RepID=UPI0025AE8CCA|nr:uncharacterized protein LOC131163829 [Malania oleifera]
MNASISLLRGTCPPNSRSTVFARLPAARDRVVDFGKHKGKKLGTLPSTYLKWVSNNLRARDFREWAELAEEVLRDPLYRDRLEWEHAQRLLNGDILSSSFSTSSRPVSDQHAMDAFLEISQRFGWDVEDKVGWRKVDFDLLGTTNGGRIPRLGGDRDGNRGKGFGYLGKDGAQKVAMAVEGKGRRERRVRVRGKRERMQEKLVIKGQNVGDDDSADGCKNELGFQRNGIKNQRARNYNPFPGRQTFVKKVLSRERFL